MCDDTASMLLGFTTVMPNAPATMCPHAVKNRTDPRMRNGNALFAQWGNENIVMVKTPMLLFTKTATKITLGSRGVYIRPMNGAAYSRKRYCIPLPPQP